MILRAGIIGCGNVAWRYNKIFSDPLAGTHFTAIINNQKLKLVAVCDQDHNIMNEMKNFNSYPFAQCQQIDDFLRENLDVVSVCVDTSAHLGIVTQLLDSGVKYIWLEKPSVLDLTSHQKLVRLAQHYGARVQVNYQRLFDPGVLRISESLKGEEIFNVYGRFSLELDRNGVHLLSLVSKIINLDAITISKLQFSFGESYIASRYHNFFMTLNEVPCDYHVLECSIYTPTCAVQISDKCTRYQIAKKVTVGGKFKGLVTTHDGVFVPPQELFDRALGNLISNDKLISSLDSDLLLISLKNALI